MSPRLRRAWRAAGFRLACIATLAAALLHAPAQAALGLTELPPLGDDGPVTLFYPATGAEQPLAIGGGRLQLSVARDAPPAPGNGRLVVVSHGSGGSPWVFADLARALVAAGYTVAVPRHRGDNHLDDGEPGPASWDRRPAEVSRAIDAVAASARTAPALRLDRVGVYGMSAGGHTALTLAGGRWSPALFVQHCQRHAAEDFNACVGLFTGLDGGWLDGVKLRLARAVLSARFGSDNTLRAHTDPRIAAVVAAVPFAADFDMDSLARPAVPLALATAAGDTWLHPRFHSSRVLQVCSACEHWAAPPAAGHGAYLSPLPTGFDGLLGRLLNDPPGFDRAAMAPLNQRAVVFFDRHLQGVP
jgi:predicted dienelactone hydrolase